MSRAPQRAADRLAILAADDVPRVRQAAARGLAKLLEHMPPLGRTLCIAEWTMAPSRWQRLAIARALRDPVPALGVPTALQRLARDAYGDVREAAVEAAAVRLQEAPAPLAAILRAAVGDAHRRVRLCAIAGLHKAASLTLDAGAIDALLACALDDDPRCASSAAHALVALVTREPRRAVRALELVVEHPDEVDVQVLCRLVDDIEHLAPFAPAVAARLLRRLARHPVDWLRADAQDALGQVTGLGA